MRTLRTITTALVVAAALAACSSGEDEFGVQDYYDTLREIEGWEDVPTSDLDKIAVQSCDLIDNAVANGLTNMEAADLVFQAFINVGVSEPEALMASTALVSVHCPIDITK